ncbi:transposable element gene, partial [Prunus dulcis]
CTPSSTELDSKAPIFRLSFSSLRSLTLNHFNPRKATIDLNHHNLHCFNQTHSHIAKISLASHLHHHRCTAIFIVAQPESHLLHHQTHLFSLLAKYLILQLTKRQQWMKLTQYQQWMKLTQCQRWCNFFNVNQGVKEGFDSNHVPPMTESAPAVVTSQALPGASDQLQPLPSQKKRKPTRQPSEVWNHFEQYQTGNPSEPIRVRCKYCKTADYKYDPATCGTSSLRTHITNLCKKYPYRVPGSNQKVLSFAKDQSGSITALGAAGFNKEESREACLRMVIIDELPFSFVDGEGFRHFCSVACPRFIPPSRRTLARDLLALYYDEKQLLKAKLAAYRVSLTTDTWTSVQNINYMVLTAHFLDDDWMLHKRVLNFCVIQNHKGRTIGRLIEKCLIDWGIERVLTITLDNASANDKAVSYLQNKMKDWPNGDKIDCKGLVVLDVPTRWNSTYMMLEAALKFKKAFSRLEDEDVHFKSYFGRGNTPPVEEDWANAVVFVKFLKSFYEFTLRCSAVISMLSRD